MFLPHKSDNGAVLPWEYMAAAAGTYQTGQLVNVNAAGELAAITADTVTAPRYLCMSAATVAAAEPLPVTRVNRSYIYETALAADAPAAQVGGKLQIAAGGLLAKAGAGAFEIVSLDGTNEGDAVRGRWTKADN